MRGFCFTMGRKVSFNANLKERFNVRPKELKNRRLSHKKSILIFLFCLLALPLFAYVDSRPSFSAYGGGAFCIPTSSYLKEYPTSQEVKMPAFRTSGSFGFDLKVLDFRAGDESGTFSFGAGVSYINVSKSLAYGASQLRPYSGFGLFLEFGLNTDFLSLNMLLRYLYCHFPTVKQTFTAYEIETIPALHLVSFKNCSLYLIAPITISVKADALTLRLSCGLKIDCSWRQSK